MLSTNSALLLAELVHLLSISPPKFKTHILSLLLSYLPLVDSQKGRRVDRIRAGVHSKIIKSLYMCTLCIISLTKKMCRSRKVLGCRAVTKTSTVVLHHCRDSSEPSLSLLSCDSEPETVLPLELLI